MIKPGCDIWRDDDGKIRETPVRTDLYELIYSKANSFNHEIVCRNCGESKLSYQSCGRNLSSACSDFISFGEQHRSCEKQYVPKINTRRTT